MSLLRALLFREKTRGQAVSHTIRPVGKISARARKRNYAMWNKYSKTGKWK